MTSFLHRLASLAVLVGGAMLCSGCTTTLVLMYAYDKVTEGDPTPCRKLNTVDRALQPRCGAYAQGSIVAADVVAAGLPVCALTVAAREPQLWPVLPDLIAKGAVPERCHESPLAALAVQQGCPDFAAASPESIAALRWLAEADMRAVQHDVVRLLSCPSARAAGLDGALDRWLAQGALPTRALPFSPLAALHPSHLGSPFALALEAQGHRARDGLGGYAGQLAPGFEVALQSGDLAALDWWFARVPELVHKVPPSRAQQMPWVPLARALTPGFIPDVAQRDRIVSHLLARGADPSQRLPHDPAQSVLGFARAIGSPQLALLQAPRPVPVALARVAD